MLDESRRQKRHVGSDINNPNVNAIFPEREGASRRWLAEKSVCEGKEKQRHVAQQS